MKAIMYGAGNIGRGFIGQLFYESGYDVAFVDVKDEVINAINEAGEYPVNILYKQGAKETMVKNVSCIDGKDINAVARAIADTDIMATAVGVNILKFIAKPLAEGIKLRFSEGNRPLNIIICENLIGADKILKELISQYLDDVSVLENVGFVEASIGRMVPVQTPEMQGDNPLRVCVEAFDKLPLDKAAFKGEIPEIKNAILFTPFEFYIERKLYIHNMGHAITAYLGNLCGYEYIWEAIENPYIELIVIRAMTESAIALAKRHNTDVSELFDHVNDLISRFGNRQLGDTVKRVGNDLKRKLSPSDRLIGAYNMCKEQNVDTTFIEAGIAAALLFKHDETVNEMSSEDILKTISQLSNYDSILKAKELLGSNDIKSVLEELK